MKSAMLAATFADRAEAGRELAYHLDRFRNRPGLLILGLPRGGIPVAAEVARILHAPLEAFVVRKLGVPGREEMAFGAVASGGLRVLQNDIIDAFHISDAQVEAVTRTEMREVLRREQVYRGERPFPDLSGETVILVDDGVATGSSMVAALRAIRMRGPSTLIAAAPVMSKEAFRAIARIADAAVAVLVPDEFGSVGEYFDDFRPTFDAEVTDWLEHARHSTHYPTLVPPPR